MNKRSKRYTDEFKMLKDGKITKVQYNKNRMK